MPPRITRNSHRPRASDRTMVARKHHLACRSRRLDGRVTINRETHKDGQQAKLLQGNETTVGWISRKNLASGRGGAFFLTSLFIELIEGRQGSTSEMAFHEKAGRSQVDSALASLNKVCSPAERPLSPCFHPHSRGAIRFARCMLGVLGSAGTAICLAPCGSAFGESNLGQAINAVTGTRLWAFVFSLPGTVLGCCALLFYAAAATFMR